MLHLLARVEHVLPCRQLGRPTDLVTAAVACQRRVGQLSPSGEQFLVHPHQVALALDEQLPKQSFVGLSLLRSLEGRDLLAARPEDLLDRSAGDPQRLGYGSDGVSQPPEP